MELKIEGLQNPFLDRLLEQQFKKQKEFSRRTTYIKNIGYETPKNKTKMIPVMIASTKLFTKRKHN
jgi:hypothetical protein